MGRCTRCIALIAGLNVARGKLILPPHGVLPSK